MANFKFFEKLSKMKSDEIKGVGEFQLIHLNDVNIDGKGRLSIKKPTQWGNTGLADVAKYRRKRLIWIKILMD